MRACAAAAAEGKTPLTRGKCCRSPSPRGATASGPEQPAPRATRPRPRKTFQETNGNIPVMRGKHIVTTLRLWRTFSMATGLPQAWDEMFAAPGKPRTPYDALVSVLQPMDPAELRYRADQLARVFTDRGVTYDFAGEERPFPLDLIPRVIDAVEWDLVARGVRQRVRALEAFLADVYGAGPRLRGRRDAVADDLHLAAVPPGGGRLHAAERRPGARGRHRPHPRRAGPVPRPRGQRQSAVRRELRDREPAGDDQDVPRAVRRAERAPGGRVPVPAAGRAARRRAARDTRTRAWSC